MRVAVHYCPYCGEQDLRPAPADDPAATDATASAEDAAASADAVPADAWTCADCRITFAVRPVGGRG